jgi:hypothetical protein
MGKGRQSRRIFGRLCWPALNHSLNPTGRKKLTCLRAMRLHPPALWFND